jgi:hypothetical protein
MQSIRYPAIQVKLIGRDSNALTVVAAVSRALEQAGVRHEEIANFYDEGCRRRVCWKWGRCLRRDDGIASGGEVNHALGGRLPKALPAINLAHADLT